MILTYELCDDLGVEHEAEFDSEQAAADFVREQNICLVWWILTDEDGNEVADSFPF